MKPSSYFPEIDQICNAFQYSQHSVSYAKYCNMPCNDHANTYTNSFIHTIGLNEENSLSHLLERISPEIENETDLIEPSKYY